MPQAVNPDLKEAFETIRKKQIPYTTLYNYYRGLHPLKYSTERLKKAFEKLDTYFAQNWVAVIVDTLLDRLVLKGFDVSNNATANTKLDEMWKDYSIQLLADFVHEAAIVTGEGYIIALPSSEDDNELPFDIYFNDPRMCHLFYEFDRPNKKRFGAKLYIGSDRYARMALYYPDRFEYFISNRKIKAKEDMVSSWSVFEPDPETPEEDNPFEEIPVFHFTTNRYSKRKDLGPSEISLQDAVNKLLADMMVAAEFTAFRQRVIISQADPGNLTNVAGANWWVPAGDGKGQQTSVQELGGNGNELVGFLRAISELATSLAIISRTPKHYFFLQAGDPSGEALHSMEAPLNKKAKKRINTFTTEWQSFAKFMLKLEKMNDVKKSQIVATWEPVETISPKTTAETVKLEKDAGIPLKTALRRKGWTGEEIKQLDDDLSEEKENTSGLAQDALDRLRNEDAKLNPKTNNVSAVAASNVAAAARAKAGNNRK